MAEAKKTYPMMGAAVWWKLREQFQKSLPGNASRSYLATVLAIEERSAANLVGPLRTLGLIQDDGKPTERANHWRFDDDYPQVCQDIREEVYPSELRDAVPNATANREAVVKWFMRTTGVGEGGARKMTATYEILTDADPARRPDGKEGAKSSARPRTPRSETKLARKTGAVLDGEAFSTSSGDAPPSSPIVSPAQHGVASSESNGPALHIDLQVHISADASTDQIDQIFASMARHLYAKK